MLVRLSAPFQGENLNFHFTKTSKARRWNHLPKKTELQAWFVSEAEQCADHGGEKEPNWFWFFGR